MTTDDYYKEKIRRALESDGITPDTIDIVLDNVNELLKNKDDEIEQAQKHLNSYKRILDVVGLLANTYGISGEPDGNVLDIIGLIANAYGLGGSLEGAV